MANQEKSDVKKLYIERGFSQRVGYGEHPAVIVVDFLVGFTDTESPLAGDLEAPLQETLRILDAARGVGVPIVFTTIAYDPSMKDAGLFPLKVPSLKWLVEGSRWVELDPRLNRQDGETVVSKKYASSFFGTDLAAQMTSQNVDTLIITGCTTSGCIRATVVDALQNGFRAIVPREAVGDRAEGPHEANLFDIDAKYGDVVSVDEVLAYLAARSSTAREQSLARETAG